MNKTETSQSTGRKPVSVSAQKVWEFLLHYYAEYSYMPTLREIADHFSVDGSKYSHEWARYCLRELERQGRIKVEFQKMRGIKLI